MIYEKALEECNRLEQEICRLKEQLQTYPEGKLICSHSGNYPKYYVSDGHQKTYIPAKQRELAESLAKKRYITSLIEDYTHELMAISFYLRHHQTHSSVTEDLLSDSSAYQHLLSPHFKPFSKELSDWMYADYERNTDHEENLICSGLSGNRLRSKSEAMIDILLCQHNIPFRYECKLELGKYVCYPDFTIRHPKTGQIYYWEHFGMMDDPEYYNKAIYKLRKYIQNGIIPSINLIITCETSSRPLDSEYIQTLINHYFL